MSKYFHDTQDPRQSGALGTTSLALSIPFPVTLLQPHTGLSVLRQTKHTPTPGPLHRFLLPGMLFPQILVQLTPSTPTTLSLLKKVFREPPNLTKG